MSTSRQGVQELLAIAKRRRMLPPPPVRRLLREQAGVSQAQLGDALGVTAACISRWEAGLRTPRGQAGDEYAAVLEQFAKEVLAS